MKVKALKHVEYSQVFRFPNSARSFRLDHDAEPRDVNGITQVKVKPVRCKGEDKTPRGRWVSWEIEVFVTTDP